MIDIVPTILDVLDIEKRQPSGRARAIPQAPGRSLLPAFAEDVVVQRDLLWWLHEGNRAVRVGDWKLVAAKGDPWELYDLREDRAEANNLANSHPDKVKELETMWTGRLREMSVLAAQQYATETRKTRRPRARQREDR